MSKALLWGPLILFLASMSVGTVGAQTCVEPLPGLVSWWPGNGDAGDVVGVNDGMLQGGATFTTGQVGQAFSLDGVDDYVDLGDDASLRVGSGPFTLDVWIKTSTVVGRAGIIAQSVEGSTWYSLEMFGDTVNFGFGDGVCPNSWLPSMFPVADGNWHHIAGVRDGLGNQYLYVDGVLTNAKTENCGSLDTGFNVYIGRTYSGGGYFSGLIDEVELFNRALSAEEIAAIFNAGSAGKCQEEIIHPTELDHFKCYEAKGDPVNLFISLEDQFAVEPEVLVGEPKLFCNPVNKNGEGISNPAAHLTCYEIEGEGEELEVLVENQFGAQALKVENSELLCVPSEKISVVPEADNNDNNNNDGDDDDDDDDDDD